MKKILWIFVFIFLMVGYGTGFCDDKIPAGDEQLTQYLKANFKSPENYVVDKFKDHDIVILGEFHRIKHDAILVQNLIPLLYKAGASVFG